MNFNSVKIKKIRDEYFRRKERFRGKYKPILFFWYFFALIFLFFIFYYPGFDYLRELFFLYVPNSIFVVFVIPLILYYFGYNRPWKEGGNKVMQLIAEDNNGSYDSKVFSEFKNEYAAMFIQGHSNSGRNKIIFTKNDGEKIRVFFYSFTIGSGKYKQSFNYLVYASSFFGTFPHLYLNYKNNRYQMSIGEKLTLPPEFEKKFTLSIPRGYHIEALQIFTPDVLDTILNSPIKFDIEIVSNEVIFFLEGLRDVNDIFMGLDILEEEFKNIKKIIDLLKPKLEKVKWDKIGDRPYVMSRS